MAVPLTQTVIPGGFTLANAQKLGFAVAIPSADNPDFILVSYLDQKVCLFPKILPDGQLYAKNPNAFENTYVIFVRNKDKECKYTWTINLKNENKETIKEFKFEDQSSEILNFKIKEDDIKDFAICISNIDVKCNIKAKNDNYPYDLKLGHSVVKLESRFEDFCRLPLGSINTGEKGEQELIRIIANNFLNFLSDLRFESNNTNVDTSFNVPIDVTTSIIYYNLEKKFISSTVNFDNNSIYNWINDIQDKELPSGKFKINAGICNVSLLTALMLLKEDFTCDHQGVNVKIKRDANNWNSLHSKLKGLKSTDNTFLAQTYNILRFPKSNIRLCYDLLNCLKKAEYDDTKEKPWNVKSISKTDWINKTESDRSRRIVDNIVTELSEAFYKKVTLIATDYGNNVSKTIYKAYNNKLSSLWYSEEELGKKLNELEAYKFGFQTIKIKVVDVRSGQIIPNARLKNLEIYTTNGTIKNQKPQFHLYKTEKRDIYDENMQYIVESEPLECAKIALTRMGYIGVEEGTDTGNQLKQGIIDYCKDRQIPNKSKSGSLNYETDKNFIDNPILHYYIFEEYNSYWGTDADGFLRIRLTKSLESNEIYAVIGFWDFPVIVEGNLTRANKENGAPTNFKVEWTGQRDYNLQCIDWNKTIDENKNFAWKVSNDAGQDHFKICQKLVLKQNNNLTKDFTLFGMQFCPPVWDGVEDPDPLKDWRSNKFVFLNKKNENGNWVRNLNWHIVTRHNNHYYGFSDKDKKHRYYTTFYHNSTEMVDFYSGRKYLDSNFTGNDFCFAYTSGIYKKGSIYTKDDGSTFDSYWGLSKITLNDNENGSKGYLHLVKREKLINKWDNWIAFGSYVYCGQIIGVTSRFGFSKPGEETGGDQYPSHLHFENKSARWNKLLSYFELTNPKVDDYFDKKNIKGYINRLPLVLPCKCDYGLNLAIDENPRDCCFSKLKIFNASNTIPKGCWAVKEFPYDRLGDFSNMTIDDQPDDSEHIDDKEGNLVFICPYVHRKIEPKLKGKLKEGGTSVDIEYIEEFPSSGERHLMLYNLDNNTLKNIEIIQILISTPIGTSKISLTAIEREKFRTPKTEHDSSSTALYFSPQLIQAQLKFAYEKFKKSDPTKYLINPEIIDGVILQPTCKDIVGKAGEDVTKIGDPVFGFTQITHKRTKEIGWIPNNLLKENNSKLAIDVKNLVVSVSNPQAAIYYFKLNNLSPSARPSMTNDLSIDLAIDGQLVYDLHLLMPENPCWRVPST